MTAVIRVLFILVFAGTFGSAIAYTSYYGDPTASEKALENQYKSQSDVAMKKGEQIFNTISGVGEYFRMPLMSIDDGCASFNAPERQAPVGDIEAAYGKTKADASQEPEKTSGVPNRQRKTGAGTGENDDTETGDGSKKLYNSTTKILDNYLSARLRAANLIASMKEGSNYNAVASRAEAIKESARLKAFNAIADLYNKSSKEGKESKVMFHLLNNAKYRGIIDDMFPGYGNAIQHIWNYYSGPKSVSPDLSMNESDMRQLYRTSWAYIGCNTHQA